MDQLVTPIGIATVRAATLKDDPWLRHLSKVFSNQIGFIPDAGRKQAINRNEAKLITVNGMPAGFMIHSSGVRKPTHLAQIALAEDAWRNGVAEFAIAWLLNKHGNRRYAGITANVRDDLRLNQTAIRMGANHISTVHRASARGLPIHRYSWEMPGRSPLPSARRRKAPPRSAVGIAWLAAAAAPPITGMLG